MNTYKHLSQEERYQIFAFMKTGASFGAMAKMLDRNKSTISREIKRNSAAGHYDACAAEFLSAMRSEHCRNGHRIQPEVFRQVDQYLAQQWSPQQIAAKFPVSHESIYRYIYRDKQEGGSLWKNLRCQKKRRKRYGSGKNRRGQIVGRRSISRRPASVEKRKYFGHWEADTVIGAQHKQAIVTIVERKSGYALFQKVDRKTAEQVSQAMIKKLSPLAYRVKTLTCDNGKEFSAHTSVDQALGSTTYFADPFSSWQRGSNENLNGLLRQYIPKKRSLSSVTAEELKMIEDRINNRPRKRLGFRSPAEVFFAFAKNRVSRCKSGRKNVPFFTSVALRF